MSIHNPLMNIIDEHIYRIRNESQGVSTWAGKVRPDVNIPYTNDVSVTFVDTENNPVEVTSILQILDQLAFEEVTLNTMARVSMEGFRPGENPFIDLSTTGKKPYPLYVLFAMFAAESKQLGEFTKLYAFRFNHMLIGLIASLEHSFDRERYETVCDHLYGKIRGLPGYANVKRIVNPKPPTEETAIDILKRISGIPSNVDWDIIFDYSANGDRLDDIDKFIVCLESAKGDTVVIGESGFIHNDFRERNPSYLLLTDIIDEALRRNAGDTFWLALSKLTLSTVKDAFSETTIDFNYIKDSYRDCRALKATTPH